MATETETLLQLERNAHDAYNRYFIISNEHILQMKRLCAAYKDTDYNKQAIDDLAEKVLYLRNMSDKAFAALIDAEMQLAQFKNDPFRSSQL